MLKKCMEDSSLSIPIMSVIVTDGLVYEEILANRQVCILGTNKIASLKVLWRIENVEEAMW